MSKETNNNPLSDKEPQMSKEEMAKRREEITAFYKDNIPHLEVQADYEMLLAAIEKARAERMQSQMFMAQQYAQQQGQEGVDPNSEEGKAFQEAMAKAMEGGEVMRQLKLGSKGSDVVTLQTKLKISADGHFGPITEKAVENYQLNKGLPCTGVVDNNMWSLLLNVEYQIPDEIIEDTDISSQYFTTNFDQVIHKHHLPDGEYVKGPIQNEYIFLHHTAGNANPYRCIDHWGRDSRGRIATEFVLGGINHRNGDDEYNGVMVQAFAEGNQGWHLGKTGSGFMNRHSVGLEICNMGYLEKVDDKYLTYVKSACESNQIATLPESFKGKLYWHKYSEEQIKATEKWIRYVGERDEIDIRLGLKQFIKKHGPTKGFDFNSDAYYGKVKGLLTHTNVRKGKMDCFPQPDFVDMIMSL